MAHSITGSGAVVAATASSVGATLPVAGASATRVQVYNDGSVAVAVRVGRGAQVATLSDFFVPAKGTAILEKPQGYDGVAAIGLGAGPSNVYFSPLDGR